jgi:hypothetical protein
MAMLDAPTMECDRVNLRRSVPVQKRQQIFETVPVRHRAPLSDEVVPLPEKAKPMATEKTDVVIVGVGAAGGILATELGKVSKVRGWSRRSISGNDW